MKISQVLMWVALVSLCISVVYHYHDYSELKGRVVALETAAAVTAAVAAERGM